MGFWDWLTGRTKGTTFKNVSCEALFAAASRFVLAELSFEVCVDLIANAIGRCEFRTYRDGAEVQEREYWLWNYEPGINQNSTAFLHKLVDHLYRYNQALVISHRKRDGTETLSVADAWEEGEEQAVRQNEYKGVTVDGLTFKKTFREEDVLHFRLHQKAIKPVLDLLMSSWAQMAELAMKHYNWDHGEHWKVHIDQMASGDESFEANFAKMIAQQVKPFLDNPNAVLPEFDGYKYDRMGFGSGATAADSTDIRNLAADIFDFTARGFLIPAVLINGKVEATQDANNRLLTYVIDPLCDQLQEEITRKRYGYELWHAGTFLRVDSSTIMHYDLFSQAASVEKLVGSAVYTINDVLRAAGQATINAPWANEHYLTKNIAPIDEVARGLDG